MFDNIAPKYDLLNHTLSMSIDRVWRRRVVGEVRRAKPGRILDVATGTGDLAIAHGPPHPRRAGARGGPFGADARRGTPQDRGPGVGRAHRPRPGRCRASRRGRRVGRCGDRGVRGAQLRRPRGRAARTGPHNKPGGKVVILEFSRPRNRVFRALYEFYSCKILPRIGGLVSRDKRAYEYLPASVGEFPAPEEFMAMMARAGFRNCRARSQSFGIAQIYIGER